MIGGLAALKGGPGSALKAVFTVTLDGSVGSQSLRAVQANIQGETLEQRDPFGG